MFFVWIPNYKGFNHGALGLADTPTPGPGFFSQHTSASGLGALTSQDSPSDCFFDTQLFKLITYFLLWKHPMTSLWRVRNGASSFVAIHKYIIGVCASSCSTPHLVAAFYIKPSVSFNHNNYYLLLRWLCPWLLLFNHHLGFVKLRISDSAIAHLPRIHLPKICPCVLVHVLDIEF